MKRPNTEGNWDENTLSYVEWLESERLQKNENFSICNDACHKLQTQIDGVKNLLLYKSRLLYPIGDGAYLGGISAIRAVPSKEIENVFEEEK